VQAGGCPLINLDLADSETLTPLPWERIKEGDKYVERYQARAPGGDLYEVYLGTDGATWHGLRMFDDGAQGALFYEGDRWRNAMMAAEIYAGSVAAQ